MMSHTFGSASVRIIALRDVIPDNIGEADTL